MASEIICPKCGNQFDAGESFKKEVQEQLRTQMEEWKQKKDREFSDKENAYRQQLLLKDEEANKKLEAEKQKIQNELQQSLRKSITADFENKIKLLEQNAFDTEEKLKTARKKELDFLHKEQELKNKEAELDLQLQRQLLVEREKMKNKLQQEETEKMQLKETEHQLQVKELQMQLEDQKKLVDEMKRRQEQGSMQLQGEAQELILEEILAANFPFDIIEEISKGERGADCLQTVHNRAGLLCGKILYESKRAKAYSKDWIEKLKADARNKNADVAVLVTNAFPKDMEHFGEKEGVWICSLHEVKALSYVLREGVIKIATALKSQENKGDKMVMLYDYLTSSEFGEQWKAIREGFMSMRISIQKERETMEKLWKAREKQLEKVLLNAAHIRGSVEGIAGADAVNLNLLEDDEINLIE